MLDAYASLWLMLLVFHQLELKNIHGKLIVQIKLRRSEGLQTVRVLAPIPKNAMQFVRGFPTKVCW